MKLSDVASEDFDKILLIGDSGTGKTCFAASLPKPMLYLDFDGKVDSAAQFFKGADWLDQVDVRQLQASLISDPIDEFMKITREIESKAKALPWKTLVIDSVSTYSQAALKHIVRTNPGIKRSPKDNPGLQDYGILKREFQRVIPGILGLPMNIVMIGHIKIDKDETTGEIIRSCNTDGAFGRDMPIYFKEVYRTYVKNGKYMAQTQADFKYACRTQRGLPNEIELSYENIRGK